MIILPAIDILDKKAVRLTKGDYSTAQVFSDEPLAVAVNFERLGAAWLHMVDLNGAREGKTVNFEVVEQITQNTGLEVEIGGGIRDMEKLEAYLRLGVRRVILGTAAVENPAFLQAALSKYGDYIAIGVDMKEGMVATRGWETVTTLSGEQFVSELYAMGAKTVICTDISTDGAMTGPNLKLFERLQKTGVKIIASGGVSCIEDVKNLKKIGTYGAIIGKALYLGAIKLDEAIKETKNVS